MYTPKCCEGSCGAVKRIALLFRVLFKGEKSATAYLLIGKSHVHSEGHISQRGRRPGDKGVVLQVGVKWAKGREQLLRGCLKLLHLAHCQNGYLAQMGD